jgi:hypothetical protein
MRFKKMNIYLEAIGGDCGPNAMSKKADKLLILKKHKKIIKDFMVAQAAWRTEVAFAEKVKLTKSGTKALDNFYEKAAALKKAGVFTNKWQNRTTWKVSSYLERRKKKRE